MSGSIAGKSNFGDSGMIRALRNAAPGSIRQPYLGSPPLVFGSSGFGIGAGVGIRNHGSDADQSQGLVYVRVGLNPAPTGVIQLTFPAGVVAGQYVLLCDWATFNIAPPSGNILQCTWTATRALVNQELLLAEYGWAVST
jgi:hypothetical protein